MLQLKYYRDEDGYNFRYFPDIRYYYDEKIQRPLSSYYDYPFRTRVWFPYKNYRVFYDDLPFCGPFSIQRTSNTIYSNYYDSKKRIRKCYEY